MKIHVVLEFLGKGEYIAYAPSLQGCDSEGETEKEALENIKEAIKLYLEENEGGLNTPTNKNTAISKDAATNEKTAINKNAIEIAVLTRF